MPSSTARPPADRRNPDAPTTAGLRRRIANAPETPLLVAVVGPGGTGKSAVLNALAREYERAGVDVVRVGPELGGPHRCPDIGAGPVLVVDDAQRLRPATLDELSARVQSNAARILLAHRPWPRPQALAALTAAMAGRQHTVVLSHLGRDAVARRIAEQLDCAPPAALIDLVHEQSGGLPALVGLVTRALHDTGRFDPARPEGFRRPDRVGVSGALAQRLRHHVDALDPAVCRLLEALAVGAPLDPDVLGALLDVDGDQLAETVAATQATGLVTEDGVIVPFIGSLVLRLVPLLRGRDLQRRLAELELARGGSVLAAGRRLAGTGASGGRIAAVLTAAATEAEAQHEPAAVVAELLAAAVEAGVAPREVAGRRARAAALTGDLDQALRLADAVLADPAAPDHAVAVGAAAAVLAQRGLAARAAQLCCRLSPRDAVTAAPLLVAGGQVEHARSLMAAASEPGRPGSAPADGAVPGTAPTAGGISPAATSGDATLVGGATELLARGMLATLDAPAPVALSLLARAAAMLHPIAATVLLPDTPAALTALVALHCGEFAVAEGALTQAVEAGHGGRIARPRHLLLQGWLAMLRGRTEHARALLDRAQAREARDELLAAGLAVGLARRAGTGLDAAWARARAALVRHPVDLSALLPLGECAVATAQLGTQEWLVAHLAEADALLARLGTPGLWAAPLWWARAHAALTCGDVAAARGHAGDLAGVAGPYAGALAGAAAVWCDLATGAIDAAGVQDAARRLHDAGLGWEGARLAGHAAAATGDRRAMAALHACARALHPSGVPADEPGEPVGRPDGPATVIPAPRPALSDDDLQLTGRELEIGELILAGLTYRQIGERLFLSEKTVEHHVARIRRRLGVGSRRELFGRLRALVPTPAN